MVDAIQAALGALANPDHAKPMQAYMRDQFAFLGIPTPQRRAAVKALFEVELSAEQALDLAQRLWQQPEREYRYVAIDLLAKQQRQLKPEHIPSLLALARQEPWWDTVDNLSSVINKIIRRFPEAQNQMDDALNHPCFWTRRTAMIHQLGWRTNTDESRLLAYALQLAPETEFFIRKAIGWALRDYARWQPEAVCQFVQTYSSSLSGLSQREALKRIVG